jgi:hypothetical protein
MTKRSLKLTYVLLLTIYLTAILALEDIPATLQGINRQITLR